MSNESAECLAGQSDGESSGESQQNSASNPDSSPSKVFEDDPRQSHETGEAPPVGVGRAEQQGSAETLFESRDLACRVPRRAYVERETGHNKTLVPGFGFPVEHTEGFSGKSDSSMELSEIRQDTNTKPNGSGNPLYSYTNSSQATLSEEETALLPGKKNHDTAIRPKRRMLASAVRFVQLWMGAVAEQAQSSSLIEQYSNWVIAVLAGALLLYLLTLTICTLYAVLCLLLTTLVLFAGAITAVILWISILFAVSVPTMGITLLSLFGVTSIAFALKVGWNAFQTALICNEKDKS